MKSLKEKTCTGAHSKQPFQTFDMFSFLNDHSDLAADEKVEYEKAANFK